MSRHIPDSLRQIVRERAQSLCEYCLIHHSDTIAGCQIDHIISVKQGGLTEAENLAFACLICNRNKGSDVGAYLPVGRFVRLFNPRTDFWGGHFELYQGQILPLTDIGEATVKVLDFNYFENVMERRRLIEEKRYPHLNALRLMTAG